MQCKLRPFHCYLCVSTGTNNYFRVFGVRKGIYCCYFLRSTVIYNVLLLKIKPDIDRRVMCQHLYRVVTRMKMLQDFCNYLPLSTGVLFSHRSVDKLCDVLVKMGNKMIQVFFVSFWVKSFSSDPLNRIPFQTNDSYEVAKIQCVFTNTGTGCPVTIPHQPPPPPRHSQNRDFGSKSRTSKVYLSCSSSK